MERSVIVPLGKKHSTTFGDMSFMPTGNDIWASNKYTTTVRNGVDGLCSET